MGKMSESLEEAVKAANLNPEHAPTVDLARGYAAMIDSATTWQHQYDTLKEFGPKLLNALVALGMTKRTHAGRPAQDKGAPATGVSDKLAELRARRTG